MPPSRLETSDVLRLRPSQICVCMIFLGRITACRASSSTHLAAHWSSCRTDSAICFLQLRLRFASSGYCFKFYWTVFCQGRYARNCRHKHVLPLFLPFPALLVARIMRRVEDARKTVVCKYDGLAQVRDAFCREKRTCCPSFSPSFPSSILQHVRSMYSGCVLFFWTLSFRPRISSCLCEISPEQNV